MTTRILLLFDNNGQEYVSRLRDGAIRAGQKIGSPVDAENLHQTRRSVEEVLAENTPAGIILTPPLSDDRHVLSLIEERRLPYARIAPLLDTDRGSTVIMDEYDAARAATTCLLDKGHRRIGFMRGPNVHLVSMRRFNGYAAAIGSKGLRVDQALIAQGDFSRESGRKQAAALFAAKPTAIFASNDEMAVGIMDAAREAGISIPGDLSLIGFDDNTVAKTVKPSLSSVRQPLEEMAEMAVRIVAERIRSPSLPAKHLQASFEVIERDSVAELVARAA